MSKNLLKKNAKEMRLIEKERAKFNNLSIPEFDSNGRLIKKQKKIKKGPIYLLCSISLLAGVIYIPALTYSEPVSYTTNLSGDASAIRTSLQIIKDNPDADFDNDGLINDLEAEYGTDPYNPDTDFDELNDYAEVSLTNTNPNEKDNEIYDFVTEEDTENGNNVGTPYKLNNVILWADDIVSKADGGVVETKFGYQFNNFKGWVQFSGKKYAYIYENGIHKSLEYREAENVFRIEKNCFVIVTDEKIEEENELSLFGTKFYLSNDIFGNALSVILPDENTGILSCRKITTLDKKSDENIVKADILAPYYDLSDTSRFMRNDNTLQSFANVLSAIDSNKCVVTSLYSETQGESIILVYGYTDKNTLLVADIKSGKPIGELNIDFKTCRLYDNNGVLSQREWFAFNGFGYNSNNSAYIRFITAEYDIPEQTTEKITAPSETITQKTSDTTNSTSTKKTTANTSSTQKTANDKNTEKTTATKKTASSAKTTSITTTKKNN